MLFLFVFFICSPRGLSGPGQSRLASYFCHCLSLSVQLVIPAELGISGKVHSIFLVRCHLSYFLFIRFFLLITKAYSNMLFQCSC